ncbi:GNAT family N-acetyltransferase [Pseudomonas duriflava]|nr:GNAT family N-acetyltransferase [Pseudomonas duriflava]
MVDFFRAFEEVAFCDWQDTTRLRRILLRDTTLAYVARNRYGTLVGAIIGGLLGTRGTINHLAVSEPYRQRGIGETLVERLIRDMKRQGVRRLFLFVDDDNATGQSFWDSQGFNEARGETTYEKDL